MAIVSRMARSSMLEVLSSDYLTTARAKGLREQAVVVLGHALKNALIPVVTVHRPPAWRAAQRRGPDRDGVRPSWRRALRRDGDYRPRLSGGAGDGLIVVALRRGDQPGGRHDLRCARSAHPVQLSVAVSPSPLRVAASAGRSPRRSARRRRLAVGRRAPAFRPLAYRPGRRRGAAGGDRWRRSSPAQVAARTTRPARTFASSASRPARRT